MSGYQAPLCLCGHPVGDHKSAGTRFPHPPRYGFCFRDGCDCREFRLEKHDAPRFSAEERRRMRDECNDASLSVQRRADDKEVQCLRKH
jgi:hypothetical protein